MFELRSEAGLGTGEVGKRLGPGRGSSLGRIPVAGEHRVLEELKEGQCGCRAGKEGAESCRIWGTMKTLDAILKQWEAVERAGG